MHLQHHGTSTTGQEWLFEMAVRNLAQGLHIPIGEVTLVWLLPLLRCH
jgi:hypothetical protein